MMPHSALEIEANREDALCLFLSCNGGMAFSHTKEVSITASTAIGLLATASHRPQSRYKERRPRSRLRSRHWPGLARSEWPSKRCCRNYCNSHHLERILMAIEWPSNAATRCGNFAFLHMLLEPGQSQTRARTEPGQTRPAAQFESCKVQLEMLT